jgi:hypothetical protein
LVIVDLNGKRDSQYDCFYGANPPWTKFLKNWGEAGTLKTKTATTPKLADRGVKYMMVGYAENHNAEVYWMWNPITSKVHVIRDIIWLNQMMFTKKVNEIRTLPNGIEANVETAVPEDGKSSEEDGTDTEAKKVIDSDGDEDGTSDDINTEINEVNVAEAHMNEDTKDGGGWTNVTTGHQTRIPERYRQEINASDVDTL